MKSKPEIRQEIAALRQTLDPRWLESTSKQVAQNLRALESYRSAKTVALYMAIGGEVCLETLFHDCWQAEKRTCIPVFNSATKLYEMAEIAADTPCSSGRFGIREPISPSLVPLSEIDLMAVPGLAFDLHGNRLGRGGGFYDCLLNGYRGHAAGIAFDFQILPKIPTDQHDQSVQYIVTESNIFNL